MSFIELEYLTTDPSDYQLHKNNISNDGWYIIFIHSVTKPIIHPLQLSWYVDGTKTEPISFANAFKENVLTRLK